MSTTITITVQQDLNTLKKAYRKFFGYDKKYKVSKEDVAQWLASLAESDVQDFE